MTTDLKHIVPGQQENISAMSSSCYLKLFSFLSLPLRQKAPTLPTVGVQTAYCFYGKQVRIWEKILVVLQSTAIIECVPHVPHAQHLCFFPYATNQNY